MNEKPKIKPSATDSYKGVKKESVIVVITEKDGSKKQIKL